MNMLSSILNRSAVVFSPLVFFFSLSAHAADWNSTGGSFPDAAWSGDTPAVTGENDVGALAGDGGVSGGSATYSIPINVVPGRAGMQPSVSLNYSSSSGNGIAGVGWSLSAGSSIKRCGRTAAQDGVTDKVHFDKTKDRLCLNGERLVAVSGTYGNSGAEYRTELDSFVKVVQSGGDIDGTSTSFTVTYKNGYKDYFGQTADSRHSLGGITETLSWMINKSEDVSGNNTMNYVYTSHGNGEYTLASISYTGQGAALGDRWVTFEYETRTDTSSGFRSGGLYSSTKRLKSITTKYQTQNVRQYRLTYQQSTTSGNSLLKSAEECGYDGATAYCFPATDFDWYENAPAYELERVHYYDSNGQKAYLPAAHFMPRKDMNGDGTLDWPLAFLNSEGEYKAANNYGSPSGGCARSVQTYRTRCMDADFNRDGLTDSWDLTGTYPRVIRYAYTNANGSPPVFVNTPIALQNVRDELLGMRDFNGDGYDDILIRRAPTLNTGSSFIGTSSVEVYLHTKNDSAPYSSTGHAVYDIPARRVNFSWVVEQEIELLGDFDGNGIDDVFIFQKDFTTTASPTYSAGFNKPRFRKVVLSQSNTSSYSGVTKAFGENLTQGFGEASWMPEYRHHEQLFDLNGDGLLDLMLTFLGTYTYRINLGNGELSELLLITNGTSIVSKVHKGTYGVDRTGSSGPFSVDTFYEKYFAPSLVLDYDQDGTLDMLVPNNRVVSFCFDHAVWVSATNWQVKRFCDDEMYTVGQVGPSQAPISPSNDRSVYEYQKVRFDVTGYNASGLPLITAVLESTDIVSTISEGAASDIYGNGHTDLVTEVSCAMPASSNCTFGDANGNNTLADYLDSTGTALTTGAYMNRNTGSYGSSSTGTSQYEVVDRLKAATTALGTKVEWDYLPLNTGKAGSDFYSADQADLTNVAAYMHFGANLNVVEEVRYSDGIGGLRAYRYKYQDATLNTQGRGFQGYKRVIVDDVASGMRNVSDYHIKYPLAGELAERRSCPISANDLECDGLPVSKTVYTWDLWRDGVLRQTVSNQSTNYAAHVLENTTTENRYWVSPNTQTEKHYQTSSSQSAGVGALQPITVSGTWTHQTVSERTFNANSCQTFARDTYQEPSSANKSVTETTTTLFAADTSAWWLCKTNYQTAVTKSVTGRTADYAAIESGSDPQKAVKTTPTWNTTHRKPSVVTVEATQGGGEPTRTTTVYNTHGLPTSVKIEGTHYNGTDYAMSDRDTTMTYTTDGYFQATVTNDKQHVTTTVTDAKYGLPTQVTDPNGQVITTTYDHFGRVASSKAPGEPTARLRYLWCSGINGGTSWCPSTDHAVYITTSRATGSPDTFLYMDQLGREVNSFVENFDDSDYYRVRRRYDSRGALVWETNRYDNGAIPSPIKFTSFDGYDNLGRLTQVRKPQSNDIGMQTNYAYNGQTVSITAVSGGTGAQTLNMSRKLNGLGQLITTTDANNNTTEYAYDGAGNPIALEDPNGNAITTKFNALGQKDWVYDPNAGDSSFGYNSLGELERQEDANGDVITYEYDDLGRIYNRRTNSVLSGVWRYDSTASSGRKGRIDYEYNTTANNDRLVKYYRYATTSSGKDYLYYNYHYIYENGSLPAANQHLTYYYVDNNYGRPKGMKYSWTALPIRYDYNSLGYMTHVKNAASGYVYREITGVDALGNITASKIGNGVMTQVQAFHPATGQMTQNLVTKTSGGSKIHELDYDYDGFSNLYQSTVTASNGLQNYETFTYDKLHRLIESDRAYSSLSRPNDVIDYTYDGLGNITKKDDYFSTASYGNAARNLGGSNAGPNAIRQITYTGGGTTNYTYDDNGNMLTGDGRTMTYNEFNKPLTIAKGGVTSTFSYGADLMRYKQVKTGLSGGTQTSYYIDKHLEVEKQGSRTTYRHYFDGVAVLHKEVVSTTTTWTMGFNLKDRLGGVVTLADENGDVLEHRSYDPFGKPRRGDFLDAGTIQSAIALDPHAPYSLDPLTDRGFTDHEHLDEQAIIHMNGRVFDYNIGRFSSVDPFIQSPTFSQSINPYSYIMNNPLAGVDPSGYMSEKPNTEEEELAEQQGASEQASAESKGNGKDSDSISPTSKDGTVTKGDGDGGTTGIEGGNRTSDTRSVNPVGDPAGDGSQQAERDYGEAVFDLNRQWREKQREGIRRALRRKYDKESGLTFKDIDEVIENSFRENLIITAGVEAAYGAGAKAQGSTNLNADVDYSVAYVTGLKFEPFGNVGGTVYESGTIDGFYQEVEACFIGCLNVQWDYDNFSINTSIGLSVGGGFSTGYTDEL